MARPTSARAAVFELSGSGRFRPPAAELLARLPGDALPPAARLAELAVAHAADRYLELRLDAPGAGAAPLLYLSGSQPAVASAPTATP